MNRKLIILIASIIICGTIRAQGNHYNVNDIHAFQTHMLVVTQIYIDGVEQSSSDIELGAFVGDEVRGSGRVGPHTSHSYNRAHIEVYYTSTGESVQFKLYNHASNSEYLSYTTTVECLTRQDGYGTNKYPVVLNFYSPFTKTITAYTPGSNDHYYLIASPIGEVSPENVTNMLSNSYDLYYFNQSQELEWRNYKQDGGFNLVSGKGYLYANSQNVTLTFASTPYSGDGQVDLDYDGSENVSFKGWNLIGNPFGTEASLNMPFYRMGEGGSELSAQIEANNTVGLMEGVFVQATGTGQKAIFTEVAANNGDAVEPNVAKLNIAVTRNRGVVEDNAIVRFDGGSMLGKFMLNSRHTKVYIPQDGQEYAVVHREGIGELPINFKAEKNDTYTLSFYNEKVTFSYLHLIDNQTGTNIDLLQTPRYSFEANVNDYESRFRLVFAANEEGSISTSSEAFAFFNNGNWLINNDGEATLQVIDLTGHILSNEFIKGNVSKAINTVPGVYMLRLIKGENVNVQKIVVR